jgi:hypothetical protein
VDPPGQTARKQQSNRNHRNVSATSTTAVAWLGQLTAAHMLRDLTELLFSTWQSNQSQLRRLSFHVTLSTLKQITSPASYGFKPRGMRVRQTLVARG